MLGVKSNAWATLTVLDNALIRSGSDESYISDDMETSFSELAILFWV